jgi:glycerophosphoryl diester phosphodiesterase
VIPLRRPGGRLVRVGHRGAAALAPENTLRSLEQALELGVDLVEIDVVELRDGTLVLAHSDDLREAGHGGACGRVRELTLPDLRAVAPELSTLDEALAFLAERAPSTGVHLDLKRTGYEQGVVDALRRHGVASRALVSSAFADSLGAVAALDSSVRTGLAYPLDRRGISNRALLAPAVAAALLAMRGALPRRIDGMLERAQATVAVLHFAVVSRAVVDRCHARGAAVLAWTVDRPWLLRRLARSGADGIITNDPRIFRG